ncbi:MAG TPA: tungstate ABC transporter substrate-binding protein WtpA [Desulfobacteraceae bacterium]|nr:tungstate ABC transporter substrate-binding protein WtpA [Desulfobacteraceae bacterium]
MRAQVLTFISILIIVTIPILSLAAPAGRLIVFHAGSLTVPFAAIEKAFEARYPHVDVLREAGGSTKMARLISQVGKPADILASADYEVIDNVLIPGFAEWNIRFAANQMVLCYTDHSRDADMVNASNWYEILSKPGVAWGHSDPDLDPCGYRSLMVIQLAEKFHNRPGLYDRLLSNRPRRNVRPKSVELVSLLKTGHMDYAWEYLSVALQHGLRYVPLDDRMNLGNYKYEDFYKQAKVVVSGNTPGSGRTITGKPCTYGVTLVRNAPNPEAAEAFLAFLLSADHGLKILEETGQPVLSPARVPSGEMVAKLPESLKRLVVEE